MWGTVSVDRLEGELRGTVSVDVKSQGACMVYRMNTNKTVSLSAGA